MTAELDEGQRAHVALQQRAAANARRIRDDEYARHARETVELGDHWLAAAERATGLSRQELAALAEALPPPETFVDRRPTARQLARRWMVNAGAPELHIQNVWDQDAIHCDALFAVRELMADPKLSLLVLSGGVGTRKSGSACWALSQREGGIYVQADELLPIAFEDKPRYLLLKRAPVVIVDDLGTEGPDDKGYWHRTFNTLVNAWYAGCRKVVFTCNMTKQQFKLPPDKGGYGERVVDRIRECGRWISLGGESVRGQQREFAAMNGESP